MEALSGFDFPQIINDDVTFISSKLVAIHGCGSKPSVRFARLLKGTVLGITVGTPQVVGNRHAQRC